MDNTFKKQEKSLGQLLLQAGFINKDQLMEALKEQGDSTEPIGKILVKKRFVREEDILKVLQGMLAIVFEVNKEKFALEVIYSKEILNYRKVTHIPAMPPHVAGIISIRDKVIPVISLNKMIFNKNDDIGEETKIIILEVKNESIGILVDQVYQVRNFESAAIENTGKYSFSEDKKYVAGIIKNEGEILTLIKPEFFTTEG